MAFAAARIKYGGTFDAKFHVSSRHLLESWNESSHNHAAFEMHLILHGTCRLHTEDETYELHAGDAVLLPPGVYHSSESSKQQDTESHMSGLPVSQLNDSPLPGLLRLPLSFLPADKTARQQLAATGANRVMQFRFSPELLPLCEELIREAFTADRQEEAVMQSLLYVIIAALLRSIGVRKGDPNAGFSDSSKIRSDIIDDYFQKHLTDACGQKALAGELGVSNRQLIRILTALYGKTFREKLIEARMDHAAKLLRSSKKSISQISRESGYTSENAFYKQFRRYYGMTPGEYKQ